MLSQKRSKGIESCNATHNLTTEDNGIEKQGSLAEGQKRKNSYFSGEDEIQMDLTRL